MRRHAVVIVLVTAAMAPAAACGRFQAAEPAAEPVVDSGSDSAMGDLEAGPLSETFACGSKECTAGEEACCNLAGALVCAPIDGGCNAAARDSGVEAGVTIGCRSERNCNFREECCYEPSRPDKGSYCQDGCPGGAVELCELGQGGCDDGRGGSQPRRCEAFSDAPANDVGACR